ncbi:PAS domain S-box protein, partial [Methylobacterium gnaphalii]
MSDDPAFLRGGGAMGALIRAHDWAATPLGRPDDWPAALRSALDLCLHSSFPTAIYWGPELCLLYNDAWAPIPAERHPGALGRPAAMVWSDIWPIVAPQLQRVIATGEGFSAFDQLLPMERGGRVEETWWTYSFTPLRAEDGSVAGVLNQGHEVTAHVRTQQALRESEAKFRGITNSIDQMIWSTLPNGFHDYYNDRWYEFTGVPPGSTDGAAWNGMFHPDDQERAWAVWQHSLETGETYRIEYRLRHRTGAYRWVLGRAQPVRDAEGRITRWFGTCTDIQEIVDARDVLARSRLDLERQVDERTRERNRLWAMTNDLMGTAGLDGYLKAVNPAWTRMLGWSDAELLGRPFADLIDKSDHAAAADVTRRLSLGETVDGFVDHILCKDGSQRTLMWSAVPEGELFYIVGRDITDQRNAEAA